MLLVIDIRMVSLLMDGLWCHQSRKMLSHGYLCSGLSQGQSHCMLMLTACCASCLLTSLPGCCCCNPVCSCEQIQCNFPLLFIRCSTSCWARWATRWSQCHVHREAGYDWVSEICDKSVVQCGRFFCIAGTWATPFQASLSCRSCTVVAAAA